MTKFCLLQRTSRTFSLDLELSTFVQIFEFCISFPSPPISTKYVNILSVLTLERFREKPSVASISYREEHQGVKPRGHDTPISRTAHPSKSGDPDRHPAPFSSCRLPWPGMTWEIRRPAVRIPASGLIHTWEGGGDDGMRASDESIVLYFCPEKRICKHRVLTLVAH
jgi:hypothetical protein